MKKQAILFALLAAAVGCSSQDTSGGGAGGTNAGSGGLAWVGAGAAGGDSRDGDVGGSGGIMNTGGTVSSIGGGSTGGNAPSTCALPSCLAGLGCAPSGTCSAVENTDTGSTTVTFSNGVTQVSTLDVTDYSTALTVKNAGSTCFTTAYIANDFGNAADDLVVKDASGQSVATLSMDSTSSHFLITCAGSTQTVSVSKSCAKDWPLAGLTTVSTSACGNSNAGTGGATSAGGSGVGGTGTGGSRTGGTGAGGAPTGGASESGGASLTGGTLAAGGRGAGGTTPVDPNRTRTMMPLDRDWRFSQSDPSGAEQSSYADSSWRALNVPHDWSIEGPFSENAPTTGRGGYVPAGVAWYRKHFTLPQGLSGRRVYVEFDGVMENSTVYVNGARLGNHPYGYVSFRYDMTSNVEFGSAENVLAVKVDTSRQPNSRYYAGSGIYRHVRIIATDQVHVDQWATQVTTPDPTTSSATVHVETSVVNSGSAAASVVVQGIVSNGGVSLSPVSTAAKQIMAGSAASFSFDVPVSNPKLWSPDAPNLYQLVAKVQVDGTTVDDDVTTFGIRSLSYSATTGLSINGNSTKFRGACLHQDYHGLGLAAPQRAMQRRLAQLKTYGINAVRTAHDPPSPEFLDLCDRMGILVMDEFFDVWSGHKYSDTGDYATYFNSTATAPTGMPALPGATSSSKWYEVDITGIIMRDRNHPSVAIYSAGNEIRDSLATRTPFLTRMVAIAHALDSTRPVTQALFRPSDSGDITGATRTLLDVFGGNYRSDEVITGMQTAPARPGVLTEMGTQTATWSTVTGNAALTGSFMWTGVDYLGEADGAWPTVGSTSGMLDAMGTPKSLAFSWQTTLGAPKTTFSTGAVAGKVVLTADHSSITTDLNDAAFVKAAVADATAPVTFAVSGPGVILAVDSGNQTQETFRGNTRNAFGGLAFAIVQATGAGTITVTATSPGLTAGSATIQATEGTFVPCSGSCD